MKIKRITLPIFGVKIVAIFYNDIHKFQHKYKKYLGDYVIENYDGLCFVDTAKQNFYIALDTSKNHPSPGLIAHECKHLINFIYVHIGQKLDPVNDELECYFLGYLVDKINKLLNK